MEHLTSERPLVSFTLQLNICVVLLNAGCGCVSLLIEILTLLSQANGREHPAHNNIFFTERGYSHNTD